MNQAPEFNKTFSGRTIMMNAVIGYLAASKLNIPPEVATAIGAIVGYVYDLAAFHIKKKFMEGKA
jgi:hypothetical protein